MPNVSAARARVYSHDKGIGMKLDLTVTPGTNLAVVTQEASRVVVETLQADLGLPVSGPPSVRIAFGPAKARTAASSDRPRGASGRRRSARCRWSPIRPAPTTDGGPK